MQEWGNYDMKIGRNDQCPCGSGKKYKNCCLKKISMNTNDLIRKMVSDFGDTGALADILCNLNSYMHKKQWWGACHASCAALYVALCEAGYQPKLCIGEMLGEGLYFDHSWIELNGYIFDLAISMTLMGGAAASEPIVFGKNIRTGENPKIKYGVPGRGIEGESLIVKAMPFVEFMDMFPDELDGLWGVVREILGKNIDIPALRKKYEHVNRVVVRNED